jgi:hypothetical protein
MVSTETDLELRLFLELSGHFQMVHVLYFHMFRWSWTDCIFTELTIIFTELIIWKSENELKTDHLNWYRTWTEKKLKIWKMNWKLTVSSCSRTWNDSSCSENDSKWKWPSVTCSDVPELEMKRNIVHTTGSTVLFQTDNMSYISGTHAFLFLVWASF